MKKKIIVRISNEIGNQLFMYASTFVIAKKLNRELLIDNETSFKSKKNISKYGLDNFNISSAIADDKPSVNGLIVRKEPKGHGTGAWIEGPLPPKGSKVTVLEDVITTGGSAIKAAEKLRDAGYIVDRVVAIVDRQEGKEAYDALEDAGLDVVSLFLLEELINEWWI